MSKKLEKQASRLVRKAETRALAIRQVVREYRDAARAMDAFNTVRNLESNREIERAVGKYNEVHRALRRIRKKIQLKDKDTPRSAA